MVGWDQSKFDATLKRYAEVSRKDMVDVINSKAYFVARKALWFTPKADQSKISELRTTPNRHGGLLVAAIVHNRLERKLGVGNSSFVLSGRAMQDAINRLIAARRRAVAFLKSGWIPAIQGLDPKAKDKHLAAPKVSGVKQVGVPKGAFRSANGSSIVATITNSAQALSDRKSALEKIGGPALNRAFLDEAASMEKYMEDKLRKAAEQANAQL